MATVIEISTETFHRNAERRRRAQLPFKVEMRAVVLSEIGDDLWFKEDGFADTQQLAHYYRHLEDRFGPRSEVHLDRLNSEGTTVRYQVIVDEQGTELPGTRGCNSEFYEGWLKAIQSITLESSGLEFGLPGNRRLERFWMHGYIRGCDYLRVGEGSLVFLREVNPYAAGVLVGYDDLKSNGMSSAAALMELTQHASESDPEYADGYNAIKLVASKLWLTKIDTIL